jgi:hypothetical protein
VLETPPKHQVTEFDFCRRYLAVAPSLRSQFELPHWDRPQQSWYETTYDLPSPGFLQVPTQAIGDISVPGGHWLEVPPHALQSQPAVAQ